MRDSDLHPVEALLAGVQSGLGRLAIVWITLTAGISVPFLGYYGADLFRQVLVLPILWPLGVVYGVAKWATMPSILPLGAVLIPVGMLTSAWAFIQQHHPGRMLWLLFTLSLLLTGPALFQNGPWLAGVAGGWALVTLVCLALGRRRRA